MLILGTEAAETLFGTDGPDTVAAFGGNDTVTDLGADDQSNGGAGIDLIVIDRSTATADLQFRIAPSAELLGDGLAVTSYERVRIVSGAGNDRLEGGPLGDTIFGGAGDDTIATTYGPVSDIFDAESWQEWLNASDGNDLLILDMRGPWEGFTMIDDGDGAGLELTLTMRDADGNLVIFPPGIIDGFENYQVNGTAADDEFGLRQPGGYTLDGDAGRDHLSIWRGDATEALGFRVRADGTLIERGLNAVNFETFAFTTGSGADRLFGGAGDDTLSAGEGNDWLRDAGGANSLDGGGGDDRIDLALGTAWRNAVDGGTGNDLLSIDLRAVSADRPIIASLGIELLGLNTLVALEHRNGTAPVTMLQGGGIERFVYRGSTLEDQVEFGAGAATIAGNAGFDTLTVERADWTTDLAYTIRAGRLGGTDLTAAGFESFRLDLGSGDDFVLQRGAADLLVRAGDGADSVAAGSSGAVLMGENGDDRLVAGAGADVLLGGAGDDTIIASPVGDQLQGNDGIDLLALRLGHLTANLEVRLSGGMPEITGLGGNATIIGFERLDVVAGSGNDRLTDAAFQDTLSGGAGADTIFSYAGADRLLGGEGFDVLVLNRGDALVDLRFTFGPVATLVGDGTRAIGFEAVSLATGAGRDLLVGGAGADTLDGQGGNDTLRGGGGNDVLVGGPGGDDFIHAGAAGGLDTILDFASGLDRLVISASGLTGLTHRGLLPPELLSRIEAGPQGGFVHAGGVLAWDPTGGATGDAIALFELPSAALVATDIQVIA